MKPKFSEREIVAVLAQMQRIISSVDYCGDDNRLILIHQGACLTEAIKCVRSVCRSRKK